MKKEIYDFLKNKKLEVNEVSLFQGMAHAFNNSKTSAIFVDQAHQSYVKFKLSSLTRLSRLPSIKGMKKVVVKREVGDLIFIVYDEYTEVFKICTLQAKYKKQRSFNTGLHFRAELLQWGLLLDRPDIENCITNRFPNNLLNFNLNYKSITAFGIFYHNETIKNVDNDIEFLYEIPENIGPVNENANSLERSFTTYSRFVTPNSDEIIESDYLEQFSKYMREFKIGAPVEDKEILTWIHDVVVICSNNIEYIDNNALRNIRNHNQWSSTDPVKYNFNGNINLMILCTNSRFNKEEGFYS